MTRALALLALVACSNPAKPVAVPAEPALSARLDAAIDKALAEQHVVGVVALVARDGKVVYARAAGVTDLETKQPVREDTVFRLASMSKPIVSVAALALVDQGKLSLDDAVSKWLPAFRPKLADGREPVITVRHLLTHTSGLGYRFIVGERYGEVSDGLAETGRSAEENLAKLASAPLLNEPGAAWNYGLSIDVLGEVVARAGGGTLPEVVARTITKPLGMTDTTFVVTDRTRLAAPHVAGKPPVRMTEPHDVSLGEGITIRMSPARIFDPRSFPSGGAGMAGTARDYLAFAEAIRAGSILKPETVRAATQNQIGDLPLFGGADRFGFGFGVTVAGLRGVGSFGWGGAYGTAFWVDPQAKLSVVLLTNTAGDMVFENDFTKAIYGK